MSRGRLAEEVALWLARRDPKGRDVAFDANHLGKIERGVVGRPRDQYIAALCAILQSTEQELGFDHASRATPDDVDRKLFLRTALGVGAGALVAKHFPDQDASDLVASISGPTAHYRRLSDSVSVAELTPAVEAHLNLATNVVTKVLPTREGFAALSEAALLATYLARQRDDAGTVRRHFAEAMRYADRAQNRPLTAFIMLSRGSYAVEMGQPRQGSRLFERGWQELDESAASDATRALLAAFHGVARAEMGDKAGALEEMRRSESLAGGERGAPTWPWIFEFDELKATRYRATTLAALGDLAGARAAFASARPDWMEPSARAMAQTDQALALARGGQLDEARALAGEAYSTATRYGFERVVRRLGKLAPAELV